MDNKSLIIGRVILNYKLHIIHTAILGYSSSFRPACNKPIPIMFYSTGFIAIRHNTTALAVKGLCTAKSKETREDVV